MVYHPDEGRALYLNETASLVWRLCDGERSVADIEALLRDAFPDATELPADVDVAIGFLVDHGFLQSP